MNKKAIIIGSGIAGLALSVRLKVKGYDVHVFEKNESYGGKLSEFKLGEYRYDFGPKLFTLPELLVDLFKISNQNIDDYIKYKKIEIGCKYFWEDGKVFNAYSDKQKLIKEIVSEFDTDKNKPLVVYCYHGISSQGAAAYFSEKGFKEVSSMIGGFEGWLSAFPNSTRKA